MAKSFVGAVDRAAALLDCRSDGAKPRLCDEIFLNRQAAVRRGPTTQFPVDGDEWAGGAGAVARRDVDEGIGGSLRSALAPRRLMLDVIVAADQPKWHFIIAAALIAGLLFARLHAVAEAAARVGSAHLALLSGVSLFGGVDRPAAIFFVLFATLAPIAHAAPAFTFTGVNNLGSGIRLGDASSGTLVGDDQCITTGPGLYDYQRRATITTAVGGTVYTKMSFNLASGDSLTISGVSILVSSPNVLSAGATIDWSATSGADGTSSAHAGFTLCMCDTGAPYTLVAVATSATPATCEQYTQSTCPVDYWGDSSSSKCVQCASYQTSSTGSTTIDACVCAAGRYGTRTTTCTKCGLGKWGAVADQQPECPESCAAGKYGKAEGQTSESGACEDCVSGKYEDTLGASECKDCLVGRFGDGARRMAGTECKQCVAGRYNDLDKSNGAYPMVTCKACQIGRYVSSLGSTAAGDCVLCPQYESSIDGVAGAACGPCMAGKWGNSSANSRECDKCAAGKYSSATSLSSANQCSDTCTKGKWSATTGLTSDAQCTTCEAGKYSDALGKTTACQGRCSAGKWSSATGLSADAQCQDRCSAGKWSADLGLSSDAQCQGRCSAGKWSADSGVTSDSKCLGRCSQGKYSTTSGLSTDGDCSHDCGTGRWSNLTGLVANFQCAYCVEGRYGDQTGRTALMDCPECVVGRFAERRGFADCVDCKVATYQDEVGRTTCKYCERGSFQNLTGHSFCHDCEAGMFSMERPVMRGSCQHCSGGRWSAMRRAKTFDNCTMLQCPTLATPERMEISYDMNRVLTAHATLRCEHGYTTSFDANIMCIWRGVPLSEVQWVGFDLNNSLPTCIGVQCDHLKDPVFGRVNITPTNRRFPAVAKFKCEAGFELEDPTGQLVPEYEISCTRNRTWSRPAPRCVKVKCPQLNELLRANSSNVLIEIVEDAPPLNWSAVTRAADWRFGDTALFRCPVSSDFPFPSTQTVCRQDREWFPDPISIACGKNPCIDLEGSVGRKSLPSAMTAWTLTSHASASPQHFNVWETLPAPSDIYLECAAHSDLFINGNISTSLCRMCGDDKIQFQQKPPEESWQTTTSDGAQICCSVNTKCTSYALEGEDWRPAAVGSSEFARLSAVALDGRVDERAVSEDTAYRRLECRCQQGYKNVEDERRDKCVQCASGTYAPLLYGIRRVECRSCPLKGVDCDGGVLTMKPDWWYDVKKSGALHPRERGIGPGTEMHKCPQRKACLVETELVPQTMYCDENHTGMHGRPRSYRAPALICSKMLTLACFARSLALFLRHHVCYLLPSKI